MSDPTTAEKEAAFAKLVKEFDPAKAVGVRELRLVEERRKAREEAAAHDPGETKLYVDAPTPVSTSPTPVVFVLNRGLYLAQSLDGKWRLSGLMKEKAAIAFYQDAVSTIKGKQISFGWARKQIQLARVTRVCRLGIAQSTNDLVRVDNNLHPMLNINPQGAVVPEAGGWPLIQRMLEYNCKGDQAAVDWILNWAAFKAQNPDARPGVAVAMTAGQGTGKTTLGKLIGLCAGPYAEVDQATLFDKFNESWAAGTNFVVGNEISLGAERRADTTRLKAMLTDGAFHVQEKNLARYVIENTKAYWLTTNDPNGFDLGPDDRRHSLIAGPRGPDLSHSLHDRMRRTFMEWDRLGRGLWLWPELRAFCHYLLNRHVDELLARTVLQSEARKRAIEASKSAVEQFHDEALRLGPVALFKEVGSAKSGDQMLAERDLKPDEFGRYRFPAVYELFRAFCRANGIHSIPASNKVRGPLEALGWTIEIGTAKSRWAILPSRAA